MLFKENIKSVYTNNYHYGVGRFSLNEATKVIKTFTSDSLGKCSVVKEDDRTILYDENGYVHSDIPDDISKTDSVFAVIPLSALIIKPKNILMIGLGLGNVYRLINHLLPETKITCIEYDKNTANITSELMDIPSEDIIIGDGVKVVKRLETKFDLVILDAYGDEGMPLGFATKEFWKSVKDISEDGVCITVNYCEAENEDKEVFFNVNKTIKEVFDVEDLVCYRVNGYNNFVYNYYATKVEGDLSQYKFGEYDPEALADTIKDVYV